jgi:hypothetical protein
VAELTSHTFLATEESPYRCPWKIEKYMVLQQLKFEHMEFGFKYTVNLKSFRI